MSATPVIYRRSLQQKRDWFYWSAAWSLLVVSWIGTIVSMNGGWGNVLTGNISMSMTIVAIILQFILTITQWTYDNNPIVVYVSRAIDALFTAIGFGIVTSEYFIPILESYSIPYAYHVCWVCIYSVSLFIAWYPEHKLVR